jgi:hypothetical protein
LKENIERTKKEGRRVGENVGFEVHNSTVVVIKY